MYREERKLLRIECKMNSNEFPKLPVLLSVLAIAESETPTSFSFISEGTPGFLFRLPTLSLAKKDFFVNERENRKSQLLPCLFETTSS